MIVIKTHDFQDVARHVEKQSDVPQYENSMSDIELTEIAGGHLRLKDGARYVTILGEAFLRGYGSPDFVLYQNSIEKWDAPDDQQDVTSVEKARLIQFLKEDFSRRKMLLEIE